MNRNDDKQTYPVRSAAEWISLAAAPTFAIMALLTGIFGGGGADMFCAAAHGMSPLSGMAPMYLLMSAFHSAAWLKLISRRRSADRRYDQYLNNDGDASAARSHDSFPRSRSSCLYQHGRET